MRVIGAFLILLLWCHATIASEIETPKSLQKKIENGLVLGDSQEKIESFMSKQDWIYSYDRFQLRYQVRTQDGKSKCRHLNPLLWLLYKCAVQVYIELDSDLNYKGYKVQKVFSGL